MADSSVEIIKKGYVKEYFTDAQIEELAKCKMDVLYFVRNYVKIQHPIQGRILFQMYPYQETLIEDMASYRNNIILAGRQ